MLPVAGLPAPLGRQGHADIGAGITFVLDGAVDADLIAGIDQGVCQFDTDFEGAPTADAGAADSVKLARVHPASTGPVGQMSVILGLLAGHPEGFLVLASGVGDVDRQIRIIAAVVLELSGQGHFTGLDQSWQGNGAGEAGCSDNFFHGSVLLIVGSRSWTCLLTAT